MEMIVKILFGSHLYGLNTYTSDRDYKGVYLPSGQDILLQQVQDSIPFSTGNDQSKNTQDDIDYEVYSLQKFLQMAKDGQTGALEMLFAPDEFIIESSPLWEEIRSQKHVLLSKKINSFLGYCRTQANKYGIKGSRMATIKESIAWCDLNTNNIHEKLWVGWDNLKNAIEHLDHVRFVVCEKTNYAMVEICGRKYQNTITINHFRECLQKTYNNYGERAKQAEKNEGIDWKALSHAVRVCCQGLEIFNKRTLTLPLSAEVKDLCLKIKKGEMKFYEVQTILEGLMDSLEKAQETTTLPSEIPQDFISNIILEKYKGAVNERLQ